MKLLFVIHQFFPEHKTGTEVLARNTAIRMRDCGHEVAFFTGFPLNEEPEDQEKFDAYIYEDIKVWRLRHFYKASVEQPNVAEQEYNNRAVAGYFKIILDEYKPDIVHVFHLQRISASILEVCHSSGIPVVYTPTDFWFMCPTTQLLLDDGNICSGPDVNCVNCLKHLTTIRSTPRVGRILSFIPDIFFSLGMQISQRVNIDSESPLALAKALSLRSQYLRANLSLVKKILVPTRVMKRNLTRFLESDDNFVELPFGIDLPKKLQRAPCHRLRVGFIGTLYKHKGAHILTEAICSLPKDALLDVFIYGDLTQFPEYLLTIKNYAESDSRIHLKGTFPLDKINEIFSELDLLVIPSLWQENMPLVAYAAQAYGCPVVASRIEGMEDLITDGINGLFFTPGSVEELAEILKGLSQDFLKLENLSEKSISPSSISDYIEKLQKIYRDVLKV